MDDSGVIVYTTTELRRAAGMRRRGSILKPKFEIDPKTGTLTVSEFFPNSKVIRTFFKKSGRKWAYTGSDSFLQPPPVKIDTKSAE